MGLILRIDVDKPYGRSTFIEKIKSKLKEDYYFPQIDLFGYLKSNESLLKFCNKNKVKGIFYFRNCTTPNTKNLNLIKRGGQSIGFHAENTRDYLTFEAELNLFKNKIGNVSLHSFTKHGSGEIKIGKHHYPKYEPENYKEWAPKVNVPYYYGNEICESANDFLNSTLFYPKMFWIHEEYRDSKLNKIKDIIELAKHTDVPIIIHPANFTANKQVNSDFKELVRLAKKESISWIIP